jgi:4,5-dihydroxyphthalate decarboxylase
MPRLTLSIALERYDRHVPFFMGTVTPPEDVEIKALEVGMMPPRRDGVDRHGRMLRDREFDVCELSLASYIMAKSRGEDLIATPVFPRRLFSQNHIFVNADSGIEKPADLVGRKVALWAWQVTMSVLAKGDLKSVYGVDWAEIDWHAMHAEELPWDPAGRVSLTLIPPGADPGQMLIDGDLDAMINPHPPHSVLAAPDRVRRLFPDVRAECRRYHDQLGCYPIMHLMAMSGELARREPWLPQAVIDMWEEAKAQTEDFYVDPGYATLAFARNEFEDQRDGMAPDLWPSGFAANRANLERFIGYCHDQGLIDQPMAPEALFHDSVLDG